MEVERFCITFIVVIQYTWIAADKQSDKELFSMRLLKTDLSNLTDTVFILVYSYLIQLLLCFTQVCEKTQKSSKVSY